MLTFDAHQLSLVADDSKTVRWAFTVHDKNGSDVSTPVILNFSGIELRRNQSESGIIAPSDVSFAISNVDNTITFSDLKGGTALIELYITSPAVAEHKIAGWLFRIKTAEPGYQKINVVAEDFLQYYLRGDYPNTRYPSDIFKSNRKYVSDNICIPVPFGTAYVPLQDVYIDGTVVVSASTIAAVASASGARCKFTDSANGLGGIEPYRTITVAGFSTGANNGDFLVLKVSAGEIEVQQTTLVDEAAGDAVTITHGSGYLMLGSPAGGITYTVAKVHAPKDKGDDEYSSASYTFTQSTKADSDAVDWRVFQAIIASSTGSSTSLDVPGFWQQSLSGPFCAPAVQFTRSDTATMTNPADIIAFILEDMGVPSAMIDDGVGSSFATCHTTFDGLSLTFNGAFWYKQPREKVLSSLLNQCHACLDIGETIKMRVLSKTSRATITDADVLRTSTQGAGTFSYRDIISTDYSDSIYVAWQKTGIPQDSFLKVLVAADAVANVIPKDVLECAFVQDSQDVQRIGRLFGQRKFQKDATVGFTSLGTQLALQPDDVITINEANYGGDYAVLIDSIKITNTLELQFSCTKFTTAFDDWGDISPTALTIPTDDTQLSWVPTISGPQTDQDIGRAAYTVWGKQYLTVGPTANAGEYTDIQKALNAVNQAGGGAIYILNGTYQMTAPLYVPNVNLEVVGQSQGGVVLKNLAGSDLWVLHNLTQKCLFREFSITSQNTSTYSKMFYIYGDTAPDFTGNVSVENIAAALTDNQWVGGTPSGDSFVSSTGVSSSTLLKIIKNVVSGGRYGVYGLTTSYNIEILENYFSSQIGNVVTTLATFFNIVGNNVENFWTGGLSASSLSGTQGCNFIGNKLSSKNNTWGATNTIYGIKTTMALDGLVCSNNRIIIQSGCSAGVLTAYGLYLTASGRNTISSNSIDINCGTSVAIGYGMWMALNDSSISANSSKVSVNEATYNHYGLYTSDGYFLRNTVEGNSLDLVNSNAKDIGLYMGAGSNNNGGAGNIFYRYGTKISDSGTGNTINQSSGGTF